MGYLTQGIVNAKILAPPGINTLMWQAFEQSNDVPLEMSLQALFNSQ